MSNEPVLIRRTVFALEQSDPRTLSGRVVPYDVAADVVDVLPDGTADVYREGFRASAFAHQLVAPHRVRLRDGHHEPARDLAIATTMTSTDTGLDVDFRFLTDADAERAATLLDVGVADLSVGFKPLRGGTSIDDDGTRWRTRALLDHVALEPQGAYPGAEVTAFRSDVDDEEARAEADYLAREAEIDAFLARARATQSELEARFGLSTPPD